jgi:hypothetical protein
MGVERGEHDGGRGRRHSPADELRFTGRGAGVELGRQGRPCRVGVSSVQVEAAQAGRLTGPYERTHGGAGIAEDDGEVRNVAAQPSLMAVRRDGERRDHDRGCCVVDRGIVGREAAARIDAGLPQQGEDARRRRPCAVEHDDRRAPTSVAIGRRLRQNRRQPLEQRIGSTRIGARTARDEPERPDRGTSGQRGDHSFVGGVERVEHEARTLHTELEGVR